MLVCAIGKYNLMRRPIVDWLNVKRYVRLFALYVIIAVALVLLYAPWALALRPSDPSILKAGFSIIGGIALAGVFVTGTYVGLKDPDQMLLEASSVTTAEEVLPVLREYVETPYVGGIASDAIDQVQSAERKRRRLRKAIGTQFSEGSMTWDHFAGIVDEATQTVVRNTALLANGVQGFDRVEYAKDLADVRRLGKADSEEARIQREQVAVHEQALERMHEILAANERMLLELGKLELELGKLEAGDTLQDNSGTIQEISELIQQTQYYA